jgi:hypothetical protein
MISLPLYGIYSNAIDVMAVSANNITVHQALHGYDDGHQLLSCSLDLTQEQQWQMLVMTDLSGPSFKPGFDGYLTGYPLEGGGFYCLARTWFAPELPRPGCVWTHTLLVRDADIARVRDVRQLWAYLRRPDFVGQRSHYDASIDVYMAEYAPSAEGRHLTNALAALLYGSPRNSIVVIDDSGSVYEDAVASLFDQQWPRLRRSFRFCTGALSIREIDFDLAVAPHNVPRRTSKKSTLIFEGGSRAQSERAQDEWVRLAADDLERQEDSPLRKFLWTFGPDYSDGRAAYRPLCEVYLATTQSSGGLAEAMSAIAHFFPAATSSRRLKSALFGINGNFARSDGEAVVLRLLATHPASQSIPDDIALVGERASSLMISNHASALEIANDTIEIESERAREYLRGIVRSIENAPQTLASISPRLLVQLLRCEPTILARPDTWRILGFQQHSLNAAVQALPEARALAFEIIPAMVDAQVWTALGSAMTAYGADAVAALLGWIDKQHGKLLAVPAVVLTVLRERRHFVVAALTGGHVGARAILVSAAILDPRSDDSRAMAATVWPKVVGHDLRFGDAYLDLRSNAFLLSIGLSTNAATSPLLIKQAFSPVYEGTKQGGGLDDHLWSFIEPYLPWYRMTWDRCKRLLRGIVRKALDHQWPTTAFLNTFQSVEQLERALKEAERSSRGSRYIRAICESATQPFAPGDPRRSVLAIHCRSNRSSIPEL